MELNVSGIIGLAQARDNVPRRSSDSLACAG